MFITRSKPEMLAELFRVEVPEIGEELIELKVLHVTLVLVLKSLLKQTTNVLTLLVRVLVMRGARVQAVSNDLGGERIDIVLGTLTRRNS